MKKVRIIKMKKPKVSEERLERLFRDIFTDPSRSFEEKKIQIEQFLEWRKQQKEDEEDKDN